MKVGDYCRTDNGYIGKIIEIEYITPVNAKHRYIYVLDNDITTCYEKEEIIKSSPNIIDLIEVGDYVNGDKVWYIDDLKGCMRQFNYDYENSNDDCGHWEEEIQSVVTKEQFESMKYKIGD